MMFWSCFYVVFLVFGVVEPSSEIQNSHHTTRRPLPQFVLDALASRGKPPVKANPVNFEVMIENMQRQGRGQAAMTPEESARFLEQKIRQDDAIRIAVEQVKKIRQMEEEMKRITEFRNHVLNIERESKQKIITERMNQPTSTSTARSTNFVPNNFVSPNNNSHVFALSGFAKNEQILEAANYFISNECKAAALKVIKENMDLGEHNVSNGTMAVLFVLIGGGIIEKAPEQAIHYFEKATEVNDKEATVEAIKLIIQARGTVAILYQKLEATLNDLMLHADFNKIRWCLMRAMLWSKGSSISQVESFMHFDLINRDTNGFIDFNNTELNLEGETFESVDGVSIYLNDGTFGLIMSPTDGVSGLVNADDALEVLSNNIQSTMFSLDPSGDGMQFNPFQQMRFSPIELEDTRYLATLFHADYMLKEMAMGLSASNQKPFASIDITPSLRELLPKHIFEELEYKPLKMVNRTNAIHYRFWIEAGEIPFAVERTEEKVTFHFGFVPMYVIRKKQVRDPVTGVLTDEVEPEEENETDNSFRRFSTGFTKYYDEIARYLPIFARLRELLKLSAISSLLTRNSLLREGLTEQEVSTFENSFRKDGFDFKNGTNDSISESRIEKNWVPTLFRRDMEMHQLNDTVVNVTSNVFSYGGISLSIELQKIKQDLLFLEWKWKMTNIELEMKRQRLERELDMKLWEVQRKKMSEEHDRIRMWEWQSERKRLEEERERDRKNREIARQTEWLANFGTAEAQPGVTLLAVRQSGKAKMTGQDSNSKSLPLPSTNPPRDPPTTGRINGNSKSLKKPTMLYSIFQILFCGKKKCHKNGVSSVDEYKGEVNELGKIDPDCDDVKCTRAKTQVNKLNKDPKNEGKQYGYKVLRVYPDRATALDHENAANTRAKNKIRIRSQEFIPKAFGRKKVKKPTPPQPKDKRL